MSEEGRSNLFQCEEEWDVFQRLDQELSRSIKGYPGVSRVIKVITGIKGIRGINFTMVPIESTESPESKVKMVWTG